MFGVFLEGRGMTKKQEQVWLSYEYNSTHCCKLILGEKTAQT